MPFNKINQIDDSVPLEAWEGLQLTISAVKMGASWDMKTFVSEHLEGLPPCGVIPIMGSQKNSAGLQDNLGHNCIQH